MYPRAIYPLLKKHLGEKQITVLTGMRRTGKTTLVKQLLQDIVSPNKLYIDLERLDNRELFEEKNYDNAVYALKQRGLDFSQKAYLVLDEIQLVKNIPSVFKYLYDHYDIKFIVTGSSSFYLKNLFSESLAGRKRIFELYPLSFGEFLTFKQVPRRLEPLGSILFQAVEYERLKVWYEEFVEFGGFPEVVLENDSQKKQELLLELISSYVNIDIASLADFRNQSALMTLIKVLVSRVGARLDYTKLSRLTGISVATVRNYLDFFEHTYLITRLPVLTKNPDREIVKATKLYFSDNGLLKVLGDIGSGARFENAIFTQLRPYGDLRYYARKTGREINFILDNSLALEVKESPTSQDSQELASMAEYLDLPKNYCVGRYAMPNFNKYLWGGDIR